MQPHQAAPMGAGGPFWPAEPLQPAYTWASQNLLIVAVLCVALMIAASRGWKKLIMRQKDAGGTLAPLGMVLSRFFSLAFREDTYKMLQRPEKIAARLGWLTWRRYAWFLSTVTVMWLVVPPTNFVTLPGQDSQRVWLYGLGVVVLGWLVLVQHARTVIRFRHRTLMQMFSVASSECKYEAGAETNPWGWVQISEWSNVYWPGKTVVMYPARFRSEDTANREAFERNFGGTVSDSHSWTYKWESANNRVICTPVPHIPSQAPYPFPDMKPWNIFPLGESAGGDEATVDVKVFPHMLIAGTTGSGKSVTQRTILLHCLQHPDWRVVLIDPKRVELSAYRNARNVLKVATELEEMTELIEQVEQEMHSRYTKMSELGVNNFVDMESPPPAVLLMVDEVFALLSPENIKSDEGKERDALHARCAGLIGSIARLGRAAGIHLVLATQRPDAKVLPGETRNNLDCRIAQGRMDSTPSRMVLDSDAATNLPLVKGRAVLRAGNDTTEFQAYFCPNDQLPQLIEMSDGLASGLVSPEDLLPPADGGGGGKGGVASRLARLRLPRLPRVPVPKGVREGYRGWVERRRQVVEANDSMLGTAAVGDGERSSAGRDLTMSEVDAVAASAAGADGPALFSVSVGVEREDLVEYGPRVGDVLRESARRGEPIAASELISALRADLQAVTADIERARREVDEPDGYEPDGYEPDGYEPDGYEPDEYKRDGYKRDGYKRDGYERDRYERDRYKRDGGEPDGYVPDGGDAPGRAGAGRGEYVYAADGYGNDYDSPAADAGTPATPPPPPQRPLRPQPGPVRPTRPTRPPRPS